MFDRREVRSSMNENRHSKGLEHVTPAPVIASQEFSQGSMNQKSESVNGTKGEGTKVDEASTPLTFNERTVESRESINYVGEEEDQ